MRERITVSLPQNLKKKVDKAVKEGDYASISEFIREAIRKLLEEKK